MLKDIGFEHIQTKLCFVRVPNGDPSIECNDNMYFLRPNYDTASQGRQSDDNSLVREFDKTNLLEYLVDKCIVIPFKVFPCIFH